MHFRTWTTVDWPLEDRQNRNNSPDGLLVLPLIEQPYFSKQQYSTNELLILLLFGTGMIRSAPIALEFVLLTLKLIGCADNKQTDICIINSYFDLSEPPVSRQPRVSINQIEIKSGPWNPESG